MKACAIVMNRVRKSSLLLASLLVACTVRQAIAGEIARGKVRVSYSEGGLIKVYYGKLEVARHIYFYRHDKTDTRALSYGFPGNRTSIEHNRRIVMLADENGNETGSMVSWTLNPLAKGMTGISSEERSVVRLFVTEGQVRIQIRVVPKDPGVKGYGEIGFYVPAVSFAGGTYGGMAGKKEVLERFPAPGAPFKKIGSLPRFILKTADGLQMAVSLQQHGQFALQDYREEKVEYRKNTWRFVTGCDWAIDRVLTLEFKEAGGDTAGD